MTGPLALLLAVAALTLPPAVLVAVAVVVGQQKGGRK